MWLKEQEKNVGQCGMTSCRWLKPNFTSCLFSSSSPFSPQEKKERKEKKKNFLKIDNGWKGPGYIPNQNHFQICHKDVNEKNCNTKWLILSNKEMANRRNR